jgi:hypothetical protein
MWYIGPHPYIDGRSIRTAVSVREHGLSIYAVLSDPRRTSVVQLHGTFPCPYVKVPKGKQMSDNIM